MATKKGKVETKKIGTVKAAAVKAEPVKAEPVKTSVPVKAEPAKKEAVKKTPAKRTAAKKEIKVKTVVEYYGKQTEEKDMIASVKKAWTRAAGKKVGDIKSIDLYVKPEEGAVYYVVNGTDTGAVAF